MQIKRYMYHFPPAHFTDLTPLALTSASSSQATGIRRMHLQGRIIVSMGTVWACMFGILDFIVLAEIGL